MFRSMSKFDYSSAALSPARFRAVQEKLAAGDQWDVIVIGAGITGAGVSLDAATRGLRVLLLDREDLAFGTSRWSSKLAHGGLRYLATGNVGIARRSAIERGVLMSRTAPHLVRALPQVVPVMPRYGLFTNVVSRLGFLAGDALRVAAGTRGSVLPRSRVISARRVAELCPGVRRSEVKLGYVNYDGQIIDDARLVTAVVRTAAGFGVDVATHTEVTGVDVETGAVTLRLQDGTVATVSAKAVVNATGVWADGLCEQVEVMPSRGTHLVVDAAKVGNPTGALTVPVPGLNNRFCFILPAQLGRVYIGITDEAAPMADVPSVPDHDVEWILDVVNNALEVQLTPADVDGAFAGLRPLVKLRAADGGAADAEEGVAVKNGPDVSNPNATADLSREHLILEDHRMITVTGGKLTEYRLMAEQTVDRVVKDVLQKYNLISGDPGASVTKNTPLVGARGAQSGSEDWKLGAQPALLRELQARFGDESAQVIRSCTIDRPWDAIAPGVAVSRAEIAFAITHEGARTVEDVLERRTRIAMVQRDADAARPAVEAILQQLTA